jgi:TRAP-type C4-dicarboxylate transport system permease small subunit
LGLPMAVVYAALPVSGFFLTLYSLALLYETIIHQRGRNGAPPQQASDLPKIIE